MNICGDSAGLNASKIRNGEVEGREDWREDDWCHTDFLLTAYGIQEREKMTEKINWGPSVLCFFDDSCLASFPGHITLAFLSIHHRSLGGVSFGLASI